MICVKNQFSLCGVCCVAHGIDAQYVGREIRQCLFQAVVDMDDKTLGNSRRMHELMRARVRSHGRVRLARTNLL